MNISIPEINFGTDGWRGVIGESFTFENVGRVAMNVSEYLKNSDKKSVCIGYDNRFMSPEYAEFFAAVLEKNNIEVDLSDRTVPTPCVSHRTNRKNKDLGIMISASHNPSRYNGIKIKERFGGSASSEMVNHLIKDLDKIEYSGETWSLKFKTKKNDWSDDYINEFTSILPENRLKVVVDYMHGTGAVYFNRILETKDYDVIPLRENRDPLFGGQSPEPKPATLKDLIKKVKVEKADIGFAFDGDADRIAVVDENGNLHSAQIIFAVLAYDLLAQGKSGSIVKTVAGTYLIDRFIKDYDSTVKVVPIGFKNICREMLNNSVLIGGEESGGIGFGDYLPERDSINVAVRILELIYRRNMTFGELWADVKDKYGDSVYLREDIKLDPESDTFEIIKRIKSRISEKNGSLGIHDISEMDGIRITMDEGKWLLMRPSGTEPVVRIYAESADEKSTNNLLKIGKELIL